MTSLTYSDEQNRIAEDRFKPGDHIRYKGELGTFICPRSGFQFVGEKPRRSVLIHIIGHTLCAVVAADEVEAIASRRESDSMKSASGQELKIGDTVWAENTGDIAGAPDRGKVMALNPIDDFVLVKRGKGGGHRGGRGNWFANYEVSHRFEVTRIPDPAIKSVGGPGGYVDEGLYIRVIGRSSDEAEKPVLVAEYVDKTTGEVNYAYWICTLDQL